MRFEWDGVRHIWRHTHLCLVVLLAFILNPSGVDLQQDLDRGFELPPQPTYLILTPKVIRPGQVLQISASCLRLLYSQLTLRISVKQELNINNEREEAFVTEVFKRKATRILQIQMPINSPPGRYFIHVEGSVVPQGGLLFSNRTEVQFEPKQLSIFIQTSKRVYHQSQVVRFRVIPVKPNLMPTYSTLSQVEVIDATDVTVRRWRNPMTNVGGIIDLSFTLATQVTEGMWKIRATHDNFVTEQKFKVVEYWRPRFDVNVTMPPRLSDYAFGVYGLVAANYTSGRPVKGNATVVLELRDPRKPMEEQALRTIKREISVFDGKSDFLFTMNEIKDQMPGGSSIGGNEVWVNVTVWDWFQRLQLSGFAYSFIFSSRTNITFLGGFTRPFKPGMYFTAYMVLYQPDGSRTAPAENGNVQLQIFCNDARLYRNINNLPIRDDGTVQFTWRPNREEAWMDCYNYRLLANYRDSKQLIMSTAEQYIFRYVSDSGTYMQLTTSTTNPTVDQYMVFNVETNYFTPEINYQISAAGNIVYANTLTMENNAQSKTFSVALSRDMAPVARIIAFYIKLDGEVVADAMTFFANITKLNDVRVTFNRGKDLNVDTLEVNGFSTPGSFIAFNAIHYDLYLRGGAASGAISGFDNGASILQDINLIDELKSYEKHAQQPFSHTWYHDVEYIERSYFPSPSYGPDANKTMNYSGLILFTDANYTKVSYFHTCNETRNSNEAFPCYVTGSSGSGGSGSGAKACYSRAQRCNGIKDCSTAVDEMLCPEANGAPQPKTPDETFQQLSRHFNDGGWIWKSFFVKPDGQIDFRIDLPKIDTSWVVGAFSVDRENGFSVMSHPAKVSGVRRFFITLEAPETSVWGEQIGIRVAVFNYWDYWAESLVELRRSTDYEVVQVGWRGAVSSYAPRTAFNRTVQTLVYLEAGESKYIYMPVIPRRVGNTTITICAYTFVGSNCETRHIEVRMNGVPIQWHTPFLLDLTSSSQVMTSDFRIMVPQQFVEPETRELRYVPGSQSAVMSIVGDVIGPALNEKLKFVTTKSVIDRPDGAGENVLFELSYNIQLLRYLMKTQQLVNSVRNRGLEYCNVVIQRALSYFNSDSGGFFNFREHRNNTSPWLTAVAVQAFVEAAVSEWDQRIYIPNEFVSKMVDYLYNSQNNEVTDPLFGSFSTDFVSDSKYIPVYKPANGRTPTLEEKYIFSRVPVTALVAAALKTPGLSVNQAKAQLVVQNSLQFLKKHLTKMTDVFSLAITSYVLSGNSDGDANTAFRLLNATRLKSGYLYFANAPIKDIEQSNNQAGQTIRDPRKEWWNDAYGTQSTALALMTFYTNDKKTHAADIASMVEWLTQQRNTDSGFSSTQDSLWALRALRKIAEDDFNREIYSLNINMRMTSLPQKNAFDVSIVKSNFSSVSVIPVSPSDKVHGFIKLRSEGTGKALLQLTSAMNVDYRRLLKKPLDPLDTKKVLKTFEVFCNPQFSGRNNTFMEITACARWVAPVDRMGERSGMSVIEVGMPTGYVVMNDALRESVRLGTNPDLRRAYFQPGRVDLYFESVGRRESCVTFMAMKWYPVANMTQTHVCRVYDYYEPGRYNSSLYYSYSLFSNNICHVCGSYECPYCPDFNAAKVGAISLPLMLLALVGFVMSQLMWRPAVNLSASAEDVSRRTSAASKTQTQTQTDSATRLCRTDNVLSS